MADVEVAEQPQAENQMLLGGDAAMTAEPAQHIDLEANVDDVADNDVAMDEAPVHHEEHQQGDDAPAPGDGIFDGKNDSAEAPLGFDDYDDGEGGEGEMDTYDAGDMMQIDLDNADVEELERQKQLLLEEKKKLIEQLKASGYSADMPAFAALEAEVQEAEAEAAAAAAAAASGPGKKRGRPRKSGRGGDLSASGDSYGDASKRKRGRPPKKRTKYDDSAAFESDLPYYQPEPARAPEPVAYTQPKIKYTAPAPAEAGDGKSLMIPNSILRDSELFLVFPFQRNVLVRSGLLPKPERCCVSLKLDTMMPNLYALVSVLQRSFHSLPDPLLSFS